MKKIILSVLLVTILSVTSFANFNHLNISFGNKSLPEEDWGSLDEQTAIGIEYDFELPQLPFNLLIGYQRTAKQKTQYLDYFDSVALAEFDTKLTEIRFGARSYIDNNIAFGAGISLISLKHNSKLNDRALLYSKDGEGVAFYLEALIMHNLNESLNAGLKADYLIGDIQVENEKQEIDISVNGLSISVFAGLNF